VGNDDSPVFHWNSFPAVGGGLCVNRVTLVCDFGHIRHTVEIEAVLDSRIEAGLRKNVMFATCLVRPGLASRHDRRLRSGMLSAFIASYRYARNPSATRLILGSAAGSEATPEPRD
jgi:hypothetical protein